MPRYNRYQYAPSSTSLTAIGIQCRVSIAVKEVEEGAYWYRLYRGTHTYDSKEMAMLIDGTIEECKEQGIETMTPNELERLKGYERYR